MIQMWLIHGVGTVADGQIRNDKWSWNLSFIRQQKIEENMANKLMFYDHLWWMNRRNWNESVYGMVHMHVM